MDFGVLTRFFRFMPQEAISRLNEELKGRGHRMVVVRPLEVRLKDTKSGSQAYFLGQTWQKLDLLIPLLRWDDDYGWSVVDMMQELGQPMLKTPRLPHGDREAMTTLFAKHGVRAPKTYILNRPGVWKNRKTLPWPMQIQARLDQNGRLVKTVDDWNSLDATLLEYQQVMEEPIYLREAKDLKGPVISALVVGDKVLANVERPDGLMEVKPGRNKAVGLTIRQALLKPGNLSVEAERMAVLTRRMYGVTHAVVDIRQTSQGPLVLDVNVAPNLAWFERMSGRNLVGKVVEFWEQVARASKRAKA